MKIANILGEFVAKTSFQDIPPPVIETAKDRILDLLGVALNELGSLLNGRKP